MFATTTSSTTMTSSMATTSVFARDQIVTVVTNMSAHAECHVDICRRGGVFVIVDLLDQETNRTSGTSGSACSSSQTNTCPVAKRDKRTVTPNPELSAAERVQQKSAIALTRLCSQSEAVSREIIVIGGHLILARICKEAKLRQFSDAVLVASLAALRKMKSNSGEEFQEEFEKKELKELIGPKLLDSFISCSQLQESIV